MGLYHFGARYYDAATGVWLTQDVYRGQIEQPLTLHRTLYVLANPVNNVDAYGYGVSANGYGDSGGGSTPVNTGGTGSATGNPANPANGPYEWVDEPSGGDGGSGSRQDEAADKRGHLSYLIHRRGRLERGPDASSIVAADSTLTAEDEPWWVQMVTDPGWQQVLLESAARHNRAETELTDEEFAAALAAIVRMESGTVGGAAVGESVEDRFKRWVNSQLSDDENERYQVVVFSKTAEIEWNYAYGHEGLMHQVLTVGGSLFGMEGARKGYALGGWISSHLPLTDQSEGLPNIHPETIRQLREGIAPLDMPTAEQIERLQAEGRLVEREGRYHLRTGVKVHKYGEDSLVAGEAFPAAQGWTTVPGFIMGGHSERIRQDQYIEYLAANLEAGLLVAQAQEVELSGTSGPLPVTWADGATVEVPRSVQVMAGWSKVGIVRRPERPPNLKELPQADQDWWTIDRPRAEKEAYETYAGGIGALYREILPYFQSQP